jgi:hypothetical protein
MVRLFVQSFVKSREDVEVDWQKLPCRRYVDDILDRKVGEGDVVAQ